jgi:hypothetical protein
MLVETKPTPVTRKPSAVANAPVGTPAASAPPVASTLNSATLVGKVIDCFGKPLGGVSVMVQNTKFAGVTDNQGNYSLGYVPGTIQVSYSKQGYYVASLTFQITTPSTYPVQDLSLFKVPPGKGIFFAGKDGYVSLAQGRIQTQDLENKGGNILNPGQMSMQNIYSVVGQPTIVEADRELTFIDTDGAYNSLLQVKPNREFYRRLMFGLGLEFKHQYELMPEQDSEIAD